VKPIPKRVRFHDLRTTFATHLHERTGDIQLVQKLLGHSSPTITAAIYSGIREGRGEQASVHDFGRIRTPIIGKGADTDRSATSRPFDISGMRGARYRSRTCSTNPKKRGLAQIPQVFVPSGPARLPRIPHRVAPNWHQPGKDNYPVPRLLSSVSWHQRGTNVLPCLGPATFTRGGET
jgi:hypothetical protein